MRFNRYSRILALSFGVFISYSILGLSFEHTARGMASTQEKKSCRQYLKNWKNIRAIGNNDPASYREYICEGFESGAPITGIVNGTFNTSTIDVTGTDRGTGAGWILLQIQFTSSGSSPAYYQECYGTSISGSPGGDECFATDDPRKFSIPVSGQWKDRITAPARGFADAEGKATVRLYAVRIEQVHTGPNVHHLVSAEEGSYVEISAK